MGRPFSSNHGKQLTARPAARAAFYRHATARIRYEPGGDAVGRRLCPPADCPGAPTGASHRTGSAAP